MKLISETKKMIISVLFIYTMSLYADYVEKIDTTDVNGYGLDSTFRVYSNGLSGQIQAIYDFDEDWCWGYFNYSFDQIRMAPDTTINYQNFYSKDMVSHCFVVKDTNNETYSKIKILSRLNGNQYIYKYGTNTTPNNRMLFNQINPQVRYNVNNLFFSGFPYHMNTNPDSVHTKTLFWDPPLIISIKPVRYIVYFSKITETIDTTKPFNPAQWDSISIPASFSNKAFDTFMSFRYFNIVTVYADGSRSDFLDGSTLCSYSIVDAKHLSFFHRNLSASNLTIRNSNNGWCISIPQLKKQNGSYIELITSDGRIISSHIPITGTTTILNASQWNISNGNFIVRAVLQDGKCFTGTAFLTY